MDHTKLVNFILVLLWVTHRVSSVASVKNGDSHIIVDSYDSEAGAYGVKFLGKFDDCIHWVNTSEVEFQTEGSDFMARFPNPPHFVVQGKLDMKNIPSGSIVDFSECTSDPIIDGGKLFVRGSYRFVGKRTVFDDGTIVRTRLPYCIYVGAQNDNDLIEFEYIEFDHNGSSHNVVCLRGNITFTNCSFMGSTNGLKVGSGNVPVTAVLQTCVLTCGGGCGVVVEAHAQMGIVNTKVGGDGIGVSVKEGGSCKALYSFFYDTSIGVILGGVGKSSALYLSCCKLERHKHCSVLAFDGILSINKTTICNCPGPGIWLTSASSTGLEAQIGTTVLHNCGCGLKVARVAIVDSTQCIISECDVGLLVTPDANGDLMFDRLTNDNSVINTANFRHLSQLYLDKKLQPNDHWRSVQTVNNILSQQSEAEQSLFGKILASDLTLKMKRFLAKCDVHMHNWYRPSCGGCEKRELELNSFLNCARCKKVCYCSKQCQEETWDTHKGPCRMTNVWEKEMFKMGFVECCVCHAVTEHEDDEKAHNSEFHYCVNCLPGASVIT